MAMIVSVGTSVPSHLIKQQEAKYLVEQLLGDKYRKYLTVFDHANIDKRYYVVDKQWFLQDHTFEERNKIFKDNSINLIKQPINDCLQQTLLTYKDIDTIISVTSTGILTPSLEVHIMNELPFRDNINRMPLFGLGCAGGGIALSRAYDYLTAHPTKALLILAVEIASVAFHKNDLQPKDIVGAALFSDGASAVLLVGEQHPYAKEMNKKLIIRNTSSKIYKNSIDVMGWDIKNSGFHVIFAVTIPNLIPTFWKNHLYEFLNEIDLSLDDIQYILAHPGGKKVIENMEKLLNGQSVEYSKEVLRNYGNMSSPTAFFVLKKALEINNFHKRFHLLSALGPGFSSEILLLEWK